MKTYNERRAVAARLREEADYPGHAVQYMEQFISDLRQVLFGGLNPTADYSEIFARLAALIDPGELKTACIAEVEIEGEKLDEVVNRSIAEYTGIDRGALLALADGLENEADNIMRAARNAQFTCGRPRMEEAKHEAYEWRCIARSIRKALGVEL